MRNADPISPRPTEPKSSYYQDPQGNTDTLKFKKHRPKR